MTPENTDMELRATPESVQVWIGRHGVELDPARARSIAEALILGAQMVERGLVSDIGGRLEAFMAPYRQRQGGR